MITIVATSGIGPRNLRPIQGLVRLPHDATPIGDRSINWQLVGHHVGTGDKSLGVVADEADRASAVGSHQKIVLFGE